MHNRNASELSFEAVYRQAYKLVLSKKGDHFYDRLQTFEKKWLSDEVRSKLNRDIAPTLLNTTQQSATTANERRSAGEKFLLSLKDAFEDHRTVMNMATDVFMYLDKVYCNDGTKSRASIYTSAMLLFKDCILRTPPESNGPTVLEILKQVILEQIAMERDGDIIDKPLIKDCVHMLEGLYESKLEIEDEKLYLTDFEQDFLSASRVFYAKEGLTLLQDADAATYCRRVCKRIHEETDRCRSTLSEITSAKITGVLEDELIKNKLREIITMDTGVTQMVDNDRYEDLKLVFELISRIDPQKQDLTEAIQKRVQVMGGLINDAATETAQAQPTNQYSADKTDVKKSTAVNQQTIAAIQWVEDILRLKEKYDHLWEVSLHSDPIIQPALTRSFTESINGFSRSSECISLFIDENMKKGLKDKTEAEIDSVLDKAIILLRYITDRDLFERYYKKHLCKRLLMQKSVSIDVEKSMIQKMKMQLGNSFTSKLEAMFRDVAVSEELTNLYRTRVAGEPKRIELSINVLTSMTWPLETMQNNEGESKTRCIYPPDIERIKKMFESFYNERHSGRMLTWLPHMGTADIRAVFPKVPGKEGTLGKDRRHELNVSTYAMFVLLLFNDLPSGDSLSFEEIQQKTNIGTSELIRNLQSLAVAAKTRILLKDPMSKDVKSTDRFTFNEKFSSTFLKLKVGVVAGNNKVEGERERAETEKKNNESRAFAIEAAVVRTMK